tara:strand:+ start:123 stop:515 length:393 start_codon:yes stop_codon:yes gene_type:complete
MNRDTKLIWESLQGDDDDQPRKKPIIGSKWVTGPKRHFHTDIEYSDETPPENPIHHEDAARVIEKIYGAYNTPEEQKENILDFFNTWKPGGQDKIREILQQKMVSVLSTDPRSDYARNIMNIMTIIGQKK